MNKIRAWYIYNFIFGLNDFLIKLHIPFFFTVSHGKIVSMVIYRGNPHTGNSYRVITKIRF